MICGTVPSSDKVVLDLVKPIGTATSRSQGRDEFGIERLGAGVGFIVWLWIWR